MEIVLGFDTSCYTTSVAAVNASGEVVGFRRKLLPVPSGQRGLRQSEAVFAHVRQMPELMQLLSSDIAEQRIVAVCCSEKPRDEDDSYMPVFTVGSGCAHSIAAALHVPCYETSHQQGHIAAGEFGNPALDDRLLCVHLSGGTTELLLRQDGALKLIGGSLDLHAGQMLDRIGVAMGLAFPAGPALEQLAMQAQAQALLPASMERDRLHFHLSGAETQCQRWVVEETYPRNQIAAEAFDLIARSVAKMLLMAQKETGARQALIVGGVASSLLLRRMLGERIGKQRSPLTPYFGQPQYSADNAAGVAWIGMKHHLEDGR